MMNKVFYDKNGKAICYILGEDIYAFDGTPIAYIVDGSSIYSFSGTQLGWFENGWIIDLKGSYAFFSDNSFGGPIKPLRQILPLQSIRAVKPIKEVREVKKVKPVKINAWSSLSDAEFFKRKN